jgi:hypothetical protein
MIVVGSHQIEAVRLLCCFFFVNSTGSHLLLTLQIRTLIGEKVPGSLASALEKSRIIATKAWSNLRRTADLRVKVSDDFSDEIPDFPLNVIITLPPIGRQIMIPSSTDDLRC